MTDMNHAADTETNIRALEKMLCDLSREFEEAQYFGSYRGVDYAAWYKSHRGEILRGYSFAGGADGYYENKGSTTKAELNLGFGDISKLSVDDLNIAPHVPYEDDGITKWPDEEHPALIAEAWSINPLTLEDRSDCRPEVGFLGLLP